MRLLLQFPEGLKQQALAYAKSLEKDGNEVSVSASPTFGACDLAIDEARSINADKLIHFGHAEFHRVDFNVEYVEYNVDAPLGILAESLDAILDYGTIGLVTTIQHIHQIDAITEFYERNGKKVVIGKPYGFAKKPGQILGCDVGSAASIDRDVDAFVYFGGGMFHPLGALLSTTKPFIVVEPFANKVEVIDRYRKLYAGRSRGKVMKAVDAKSFGILLTTKNGQHNEALARILKARIEQDGLTACVLTSNTFDFVSLENMREFDAFVNTACPRIAIDDTDRISKPLLSANELMEVLRMKKELAEIRAKR
ncbi:MAG: diphthamide biosynthesis enzyme Dph2 [Candidatus Marsarchaeota archaeon]|jgi:2-(3-amino-3-carboxypropyl)histidine synthase|nr:diphthamide biosynthesis enzyme Dph2 [Candidatus Marsarchaeota archaeon]MCL5111606.1 diphthamide biosynthesis enzyme Dph2 [Candidatus Marsarchaeota archaeon]